MPSEIKARPPSVALPHWPVEIHAWSLAMNRATMPNVAGLNTCLPRIRSRNLLPIASPAAATASAGVSVRNRRLSDSDVMSGLNGSNRPVPSHRVSSHCVPSAVMKMAATLLALAPMPSSNAPNVSRVPSATTW